MIWSKIWLPRGFAGGSVAKNISNAGVVRDTDSIPGSGKSPGVGHGKPLQSSCLENPINREAWQATVNRVAKSWTRLKQQPVCMHDFSVLFLQKGCDWVTSRGLTSVPVFLCSQGCFGSHYSTGARTPGHFCSLMVQTSMVPLSTFSFLIIVLMDIYLV